MKPSAGNRAAFDMSDMHLLARIRRIEGVRPGFTTDVAALAAGETGAVRKNLPTVAAEESIHAGGSMDDSEPEIVWLRQHVRTFKRLGWATMVVVMLYLATGFMHCAKGPRTGWKVCKRNGYYLGDFILSEASLAPLIHTPLMELTPDEERLLNAYVRCTR